MTEMTPSITERLKSLGLKMPAEEMPKLEKMITDFEAAAEVVRGPRPYAEEPLSAFRLRRA